MKYLGKKKLYERMQELSSQIGCEIPKMKDCEYKFYRGDEWLKWEYYEKDRNGYDARIEVSANIFYRRDGYSHRITRVFIDEYMEGYNFQDSGEEIKTAQNNYKFYDNLCEYCSVYEPCLLAQGRWKRLAQEEVHYE